MIENINKAVSWIKDQRLPGVITGSILLGHFPGEKQDIDFFAYTEESFTQMYYAMYYNPMFTILDSLELWKSKKFMEDKPKFHKSGVQTLKFWFNTCIEINLIYKPNCPNAYSVISTFDLDIICKGYDTFLEKELDLSGDSKITKIVSWNKWNTNFYNPELWQINRLLRQLERVFKFYKRGYNTDSVVLKYIEIIDSLLKINDIFHSSTFSEKLDLNKKNALIIKQICLTWLENHSITDEEIKLLNLKVREL